MTIDDLVREPCAWLEGSGPMSDVVISSRIRLARNLAHYPFRPKAGTSDLTDIYRAVTERTESCTGFDGALLIDLEQCEPLDREVLVERHLISRLHAESEGPRGVVVSPGESCAVMVNEEDHVRIQGLTSGLQLEPLWSKINQFDDELSDDLEFAFDERLGFLTACPTNLGTGIRVSVMLHLPALKLTQEIARVARAAEELKLAVRGWHGEGTDAAGDFYQISNQTTLGKSEEEIIKELGETVIPQVVQYERAAREALVTQRAMQLDDRIWRAYGLLQSARIISSEEVLTHLSHLRLGIHAGRFKKLDIVTLNALLISIQPAHLQKTHGESLSDEERDELRAELIRHRLQEAA